MRSWRASSSRSTVAGSSPPATAASTVRVQRTRLCSTERGRCCGVGHAEQELDQRPVERGVARVDVGGDAGELEHGVDRLRGGPHVDGAVEALERIVQQRVEHAALRAEQVVRRDEADLGLLGEPAHREVGAAGRADQPARGVEDLLAPLAPLFLAQSHSAFEFYNAIWFEFKPVAEPSAALARRRRRSSASSDQGPGPAASR